MNTCKGCLYWGAELFGEAGRPFAPCMADEEKADVRFRLDTTYSDSSAVLLTRDDFGCVEFVAKADAPET